MAVDGRILRHAVHDRDRAVPDAEDSQDPQEPYAVRRTQRDRGGGGGHDVPVGDKEHVRAADNSAADCGVPCRPELFDTGYRADRRRRVKK